MLVLVLLPLLIVTAFCVPLQESGSYSQQTVFSQPAPLAETVGWIDPRVNGGRWLDVRYHA